MFFFLGTKYIVGHGSGTKRPTTNPSPRLNLPTMVMMLRAKQLSIRGREPLVAVRRATWVWGNASKLLTGRFASTSPPTLTAHNVATAIAHHKRSARSGSTILVWCQPQPPRLVSLKPPSIQLRMPYQTAVACAGAKSVRSPTLPRSPHPSARARCMASDSPQKKSSRLSHTRRCPSSALLWPDSESSLPLADGNDPVC